MPKTILLALKQGQTLAVLFRDLEKVIERSDRIVFLVEYRPDIPSCLLAETVLLQTGVENGVATEARKARLTWDEQKLWAEKNLAQSTRREFNGIGVEVEVDLYCGSLNRAVRRYLDNNEALIYWGAESRLARINVVPAFVKNWFGRRGRHHSATSLMNSKG